MTRKDNSALYFELGWALIRAHKFADGFRKLGKFLAKGPIDPLLRTRAEQLRIFANNQIENAKKPDMSPVRGQTPRAYHISNVRGADTAEKSYILTVKKSPSQCKTSPRLWLRLSLVLVTTGTLRN